MKPIFRFSLIILLSLSLWACSGGQKNTAESSPGNANAGAELFAKPVLGSQAGCKTCHSLQPGVVIVGPSLAGIASLAAEREADKSAEEYLRESITAPNQYLVEGYPENVMPLVYEKELTAEEIDSLVAYMLTLK